MIRRIKKAVQRRAVGYLEYLAKRKRLCTCKVRGHAIQLWVESAIEKYRAKTYDTKEPETLDWIERYVQPGDVFYDIGANIGLYSIFAAKHLRGEGKVYAFEPEALNFARLSKNIQLNGLSGTVVPCCLALSDSLCFDLLYLNPNNFEEMAGGELVAGTSLHSFGVARDYSGKSFRPFHTQGTVGVSIDFLWQVWKLDFPNHLKIDVDGLEDKIIDGAARTLEDRRLKSVLIEISAKKGGLDPIHHRLIQAGFVPVTDFPSHSSKQLAGSPYENCLNCVFVRMPQATS